MDPSIKRLWFFFFPIHKNGYRHAFSTSPSTYYKSPSNHKILHNQKMYETGVTVLDQKMANGWHLGRELTCSLHTTTLDLCVANREGIKSTLIYTFVWFQMRCAWRPSADSYLSASQLIDLISILRRCQNICPINSCKN
jgi:hypothetical protein